MKNHMLLLCLSISSLTALCAAPEQAFISLYKAIEAHNLVQVNRHLKEHQADTFSDEQKKFLVRIAQEEVRNAKREKSFCKSPYDTASALVGAGFLYAGARSWCSAIAASSLLADEILGERSSRHPTRGEPPYVGPSTAIKALQLLIAPSLILYGLYKTRKSLTASRGREHYSDARLIEQAILAHFAPESTYILK